ncbi:MAG TPA: LuxR C-terminal-related transcriptional regulator [Polyangiaceae bacterium]
MQDFAVPAPFISTHPLRRVAELQLADFRSTFELVEAPRRTDEDDSVRRFWRGLVNGELRVLETFALERYCCAIAEERPLQARKPLNERELVMLHRAIQAETQKVLAAGFDLSVPAVSQLLSGALRKLGVACRVQSTPLPIVLVGLRYCGTIHLPPTELFRFEHEGGRYVALGLPALDSRFLPDLSPAERQVAWLTAIGQNPTQIAEQRQTAACTVTNQVAALHKKLAVHGRFELIRRWACLQWGSVNAG